MMTASFGMTKKPNHVEWFWNIGKKNAIYRNFCRTKRTRLTTKGPCAMDQNGPNSGRDRAADALVKTFETFIFEGTWKDGDPLPPERVIVQEYGVSRTVVREAVLALSNKGLVEARPRFRPVVRRPDYDAAVLAAQSVVRRLLVDQAGVRNLFDLRIMMEAALVEATGMEASPIQTPSNSRSVAEVDVEARIMVMSIFCDLR